MIHTNTNLIILVIPESRFKLDNKARCRAVGTHHIQYCTRACMI